MRKNILFTGIIAFAFSAFLLNSCKKDDTTAPTVSLNGSSSMTLSLNSTAPADPGATASDDQDGTISNVTSNWSSTNPDVNHAGTYTITYSATDAAGNTGNATRTVIVKNDAAYLAGTYLCSEDNFVHSWTQTITADETHNNRIIFQFFADYVTFPLSPSIYAQVTGSNVELPTSQIAVGGASGCTHTFTTGGTGTIPIALVSGKYNFSIKFNDQESVGGSSCPGTAPISYEDVCHQQ